MAFINAMARWARWAHWARTATKSTFSFFSATYHHLRTALIDYVMIITFNDIAESVAMALCLVA